jgi:hypothetical protein
MVKPSRPLPGASVHAAIRGESIYFESQNQIFADIDLQASLDAQAHFGESFAHNPARHWDLALTKQDKQNHGFLDPGRIRRRKMICSLNEHGTCPFRPSVSSGNQPQWNHSYFVPRANRKICSNLNTWLREILVAGTGILSLDDSSPRAKQFRRPTPICPAGSQASRVANTPHH